MPDERDNSGVLERKLATILSADVAGYSRLMGEDEEQTLKTFRGHKKVFESLVTIHRGRIFNTAGDAILAEFGSAVEAVRCATDIQSELRTRNDQLAPSRQVRFRIGINLGDVMVQGQDLMGDGVNVAARLQTAAEPGGICISGSVHDQIRNKLSLSFQSHGEMSFKNIQQPVRTFSITEADAHGTRPSPKPRRVKKGQVKWIAAGAAAIIIAAAAGAGYFLRHKPAPKLTDKDTIVLADFTNTTGDPVFDGTLRQGLAIQLEQSPFLKIMDDELVQQDLRLMSLPAGARITNQIAHDVCVREGVAATIDGSIESLGKNYVITLQATTCRGGATLAREQIQAGDKENVLNALGTAATAMRAKLGESLNSIQKLNRPLEQATTPSLEALQNYTAGYSDMGQGQFLEAVPLFQRAIALDPSFAMASFMLGGAFDNAGDIERSREYTQKAFGLIDRVSEFERDLIAASYYSYDGQSDKAIDAYRLGVQNYPRFWGFHNDLSVEYIDLGQFEEGLKEGQEATRLEANVEPPYRRLMDAYLCLDRLTEAKQVAEKLRAQGLGGARIHQRFLEIAYVEGDDAAAADRKSV